MKQTNDVNDCIGKLLPWMQEQFTKNKKTQVVITFCRGEERLKRLVRFDPIDNTLIAFEFDNE